MSLINKLVLAFLLVTIVPLSVIIGVWALHILEGMPKSRSAHGLRTV